MRKVLKIFSLAMVFAGGLFFVFTKGQCSEKMSDFALENVEALSGADVSTSWNCVGVTGSCYKKCGVCGTEIKGKGNSTGNHSCSFN